MLYYSLKLLFVIKAVCLQVVEAVPTLPEIPLPAIQPNYRPLPSIEVTPLSPQRRKGNTFTPNVCLYLSTM